MKHKISSYETQLKDLQMKVQRWCILNHLSYVVLAGADIPWFPL